MYPKALSGRCARSFALSGGIPRMIATTGAHNGETTRSPVVAVLAEEHGDAPDVVASGVDAGRVSAGSAVDAVADAVAREEAV